MVAWRRQRRRVHHRPRLRVRLPPGARIKLATNSEMYTRMAEDMDINCGRILDGTASVEQVGRAIFSLIVDTASGKQTKSEELGFGDEEFAPWQLGAVM